MKLEPIPTVHSIDPISIFIRLTIHSSYQRSLLSSSFNVTRSRDREVSDVSEAFH